MRAFRELVERQIARARSRGLLTGLKGEGKPLPSRCAETGEAAAVSAGYRVMAEAGVLPEEFTFKKELEAARVELLRATDQASRKAAQARVADLEMRMNIAIEARKKFMS